MTSNLKILSDNRDALLLAEVGAWLHDMGKCSDEMIKLTAWDKPDDFKYEYKTFHSSKVGTHTIKIFGEPISLMELIKRGKPGAAKENSTEPWIVQALGRCHAAAHIEKEEPLLIEEKKKIEHEIQNKKGDIKRKKGGAEKKRETALKLEKMGKGDPEKLQKQADSMEEEASTLQAEVDLLLSKIKQVHQSKDNTLISSPFGFEIKKISGLTEGLENLPYSKIKTKKREMVDATCELFKNALGDTRRPVNEITLTDWSSIVAALYKAALAGALLGNKPEPNDLKWRLLAIRFNSEQIWGNTSKITVLLARRKWLTDGLDNVKKFLEETYPLGNEVYRDENGCIFVVPDIKNLLEIIDSDNGKTLEELILENLGYDGEIVITPALSDNWWGQKPPNHLILKDDKISPIGKILKEKPYSPPNPEAVKEWWEKAISKAQKEEHNNPEICTISWLRPQGPTSKGFQRKASDYWVYKISGRAEDWYNKHLNKTIWIDEVADSNGRICLIVGKLGIEGWLSPDGCIKTLFVKPPNGDPKNTVVPKIPSFARIRRVWETTKTFWKDVEQDFNKTVGSIDDRLKIIGKFEPKDRSNHLLNNNTYEAELDAVRFSIFNSNTKGLLVIENLQWLAKKMGADQKDLEPYESLVEYVKRELEGKPLKIYDPEGRNREKSIGSLIVSKVEGESTSYTPAISILSEPSTFMAIVPANEAMKVAKGIKEKYEEEIGKVRNRLPLTMGMVFAKSHTPLVALMDAGRRMLNVDNKEEDWTLTDTHDCGMHCTLNFENGIIWHVPVKMGDGVTDDVWYPYFYVNGLSAGRSKAFKSPKGWLVHVTELKKGDKVKVIPSRFDFEFLDTSSRRFEVSYKNGKRRNQMKTERPYLLEELDDFKELWDVLWKGLARSQIKNVIELIETKRGEWLPEEGNEVFEKFVHDVLHNANWKNGMPEIELDKLEKAAVSGKLRDIVELYMDIIKDGIKKKKEGSE